MDDERDWKKQQQEITELRRETNGYYKRIQELEKETEQTKNWSKEVEIKNNLLECCEKCEHLDLEVTHEVSTQYSLYRLISERTIEIKIGCRHSEVCREYM
jgi:hypothetical protein